MAFSNRNHFLNSWSVYSAKKSVLCRKFLSPGKVIKSSKSESDSDSSDEESSDGECAELHDELEDELLDDSDSEEKFIFTKFYF